MLVQKNRNRKIVLETALHGKPLRNNTCRWRMCALHYTYWYAVTEMAAFGLAGGLYKKIQLTNQTLLSVRGQIAG